MPQDQRPDMNSKSKIYPQINKYDLRKNFRTNQIDPTYHLIIQSFVKACQKYDHCKIRLIFVLIIPIYLFLAGSIITKLLYFVYDVNNGVFLASDFCFMFRYNNWWIM